jgi:predicted AlkP superfamily phosphohydrolase/phosphomutase/Tfp pilus assembly protein PilF
VNRRVAFVFLLGGLIAIVIGFWLTHRGPAPTTPTTATTSPAPAPNSSGGVADIAARAEARPPVIFIGLDGADWALLDQYAGRGVMPVLRGLIAEGATGTLQTIHPALSPLIWNTMLTGVSPLEHRVLDFLRVNPVSGQREPITSDERKAPAVWNMATAAGKRVAALGFWATYPAEAVNGLVVSDRLFTFLYSESEPPPGVVNPRAEDTWARDTLKQVEEDVNYAQVREILPWLSEDEYRTATAAKDPYAHPVGALRRLLIETRVYDRLGREYFARAKPDLTVLYIQGTDTVGHVFAPYAPPRQPSIPPADFERYSAVAERYFAQIDRMLGEYRKLAESAGAVLVLGSDHGFKWGEGRPETLSSVANATAAKWHTDNGIYLIWGAGTKPSGGHTGSGGVAQVTATLLALAGVPAAANVAGPPLPGAPAPVGTPVDYTRYYTPASVISTTESAARSKVDQETVDKLRALGYIGAAGGDGHAIGTRTGGSFNNEGLLLKASGKTTDAVEAFESALTVDPNLASALWNLSDLLFAERRSLDKSDALLVRAFANGLPEGRRYLIGRAIGYQREGRVDRSLKLLTDAATAKSDDAEVWLFRGRYRVETGDCVGAVTDFQRAIHLDSANAASYASLGLGQMCAGDKAAARDAFKRSLALDPNQPKLREMLRER